MQTRSYADAGGIRTLIPYLFTSFKSQKQKSAIRHHVSHGYVYTNTWPKVADSITVSSNPNEPCHEKPVIGDMRGSKTQTSLLSGYTFEVLVIASSTS